MNINERQSQVGSTDITELFRALFRHKWKIFLFGIAGLISAAVFYIYRKPVYESEAKLLVRYVLERSAIDSVESQDGASGSNQSDGVISSEVEILTSWDLAVETAEAIGVERLLPGSAQPTNSEEAALCITKGLIVNARKGSNVMLVAYRNSDPAVATAVLRELVSRYFAKHLEVHRSTDAFDFVTQQTDQVRARLRQTEEQLKEMKAKEGIISVGESTSSLTAQLTKSHSELLTAQAERVERIARVKEIEKWINGNLLSGNEETPKSLHSQGAGAALAVQGNQANIPDREAANLAISSSGDSQRYQALIERLAVIRQSELELLSKYAPENELVRGIQIQIQKLDLQRRELETQFPNLTASAAAKDIPSQASQLDLISERASLAAIEAKLEMLQSQYSDAQKAISQFSDLGTQISQLERRRDVEETNYKYFESSLEKARIDEALDPSKMPNISVVQKPSTAMRVTGLSKKIVIGLAGGGLALGIGIALLIELLIDRSVRRSSEIERRFGMSLMRSIPYISPSSGSYAHSKGARSTIAKARKPGNSGELLENPAPWEAGHFIRPHCESIRARTVLYFEQHRMTHKPKLIAVTGCLSGSGASTIAAGLAASLSETGDGKVLLVNMNDKEAELHPFFGGNPACPLTEAIEPGKQIASASGNLYLATATSPGAGTFQDAPKKLYELFPSLKASDFDYIIFDIPAFDRSSVALSIAGFVDKVILVVESERCQRTALSRVRMELTEAKANVSVVFNKARSYAPRVLEIDS